MISSSQSNFIKQRNERMLQLAQDGKPYSAIARELGCSNSTVSKELTKAGMGRYKQKGITLVASQEEIVTPEPVEEITEPDAASNTCEVSYKGRKHITTLEELLEVAQVDLNVWTVEEFTVNQWEMGYVRSKSKDGNAVADSYPLYQVKARLRRIKLIPLEFEAIAPVSITIKTRPQSITTRRGIKRAVIIPDMQVGFYRDPLYGTLSPLHDRKAIDIALQVIEKLKPDTVVWLGDDLDLADWSIKYASSPAFKQSTQAALVELAWMMGKVRASVPNARLIKIAGNHDERVEKLIVTNMQQAYQLRAVDQLSEAPALSVERLLNLKALGIEYKGGYPQGEFWLNDNFRLHHGEVVRGQSGKTVAAVAQDLRSNEAQGHIHRVECAVKTVWSKEGPKIYQAWSFGTLASIMPGVVPGFKSHQNWQNAVGVIDYEDTDSDIIFDNKQVYTPFGLSTVTPVLIYDRVAIYDLQRYEARREDVIVEQIVNETGFDVTMGYLSKRKAA